MMDDSFLREQELEMIKSTCFHDPALYNWSFKNDNGKSSNIKEAKKYVEEWNAMFSKNIGLLLWGDVGTGKTFFAACIANQLIENNIAVRMTDFSTILNDLYKAEDKNRYISDLVSVELLIIDDLGIERDTPYALEQVFSVVDARYRSNRPLIITTNLSLSEIKNPTDVMHKRIYDRVLEMCVPIKFMGNSMRGNIASSKIKIARGLIRGEN